MLITNFSSGELSPTLNGRVDLQQYWQGASRLENFEIIPTGGIRRRTGFKRIFSVSQRVRLIPFIINKTFSFILCVGPNEIKAIRTRDSQQYNITGFPYTTLTQIDDIHYAQNYDTLIMTSKNHAPYKITYSMSSDTFSAGTMAFDFIPDVNLDDDYDFIMKTTNLSAVTVDKTNKYVEYNDPEKGQTRRSYTDENQLYMISAGKLYKYSGTAWNVYDADPDTDAGLFTEENKCPACVSFYNNRLFFASTNDDPQKVWASATPDTTGSRYNDYTTYQKYVTVNKILKDADIHIFTGSIEAEHPAVIKDVTQDFTKSDLLIKAIENYFVTNQYIPVGTRIVSVTASTITLSQAASITEDVNAEVFNLSLWKVATTPSADDYEMQVVSNNVTTSDCSFSFELGSQENDAINFIAAGKYLTIGTESSVWCVPPSITALSLAAENTGRYGSDTIQALVVDTATVFFAQGRRAIREHYYNAAGEAFQTNNIAIMADQMLTESPAVDFDYLNNPYNKIIAVREDGKAVQMLYDKNNGVMGWTRTTIAKGNILQCCVTRGEAQNDLLYYLVKIGEAYYIELLDDNNQVYLDDYRPYTQGITIPDGMILYNQTQHKTCEDPSQIPQDFIATGDDVYVGYRYTSDIISMPVMTNDPTNKKRITSLLIRFLESYMPELKIEDMVNEKFLSTEGPFSGIKEITYPGISDRDIKFELTSDLPEAITILSINASIS